MTEKMLVIEGLTKRFGRVTAVNNINFSLERGCILGLLGPNGSGKTTLLNLIGGIYKPTRGRILIDGMEPGVGTKKQVAILPEPDHLYPWMKVGSLLDFIGAFFDDWCQTEAEKLVGFMKLPLDKAVGKLSRGQRARLKLVTCMARSAPLVLLDEPFSGIDPVSRRYILEAIIERFQTGKQTAILSTHEINEVEQIFERALFLARGQIVLVGGADELREKKGKSLLSIFEEVYAE